MTNLDKLPNEVLLGILLYINITEISSVACLNKHMQIIVQLYWKDKLNIHFPASHHTVIPNKQGIIDYKSIFQQTYLHSYERVKPSVRKLFSLVKEGKLQALKCTTIYKSDLKVKDSKGYNLVKWSIVKGHQDIADYFYQKIVTINGFLFQQKVQSTFKWALLTNQSIEEIDRLIKLGADINYLQRGLYHHDKRIPLLYRFVFQGHERAVEILLSKGINIEIAIRVYSDFTLLHAALQSENIKILQLLLEAFAEQVSNMIISQKRYDENPLQYAAKCGSVEQLRMLCNRLKGIDIKQLSQTIKSALRVCIFNPLDPLLERLRHESNQEERKRVFNIMSNICLQKISLLLNLSKELTADILLEQNWNYNEIQGGNYLHFISSFSTCNDKVIGYLLNKLREKAPQAIMAKDARGKNLLYLSNCESLKLLIDILSPSQLQEALLDRDVEGKPCLYNIVYSGSAEKVTLLINALGNQALEIVLKSNFKNKTLFNMVTLNSRMIASFLRAMGEQTAADLLLNEIALNNQPMYDIFDVGWPLSEEERSKVICDVLNLLGKHVIDIIILESKKHVNLVGFLAKKEINKSLRLVIEIFAEKAPEAILVQDASGCNAFHYAVSRSNVIGVQQLLDVLGSEVLQALKHTNKSGRNCLHEVKSAAVAQLLIQALGTKAIEAMLQPDEKGRLPLHYAVRESPDLSQVFLKALSKDQAIEIITTKDKDNQSCFYHTITTGRYNSKTVEVLLEIMGIPLARKVLSSEKNILHDIISGGESVERFKSCWKILGEDQILLAEFIEDKKMGYNFLWALTSLDDTADEEMTFIAEIVLNSFSGEYIRKLMLDNFFSSSNYPLLLAILRIPMMFKLFAKKLGYSEITNLILSLEDTELGNTIFHYMFKFFSPIRFPQAIKVLIEAMGDKTLKRITKVNREGKTPLDVILYLYRENYHYHDDSDKDKMALQKAIILLLRELNNSDMVGEILLGLNQEKYALIKQFFKAAEDNCSESDKEAELYLDMIITVLGTRASEVLLANKSHNYLKLAIRTNKVSIVKKIIDILGERILLLIGQEDWQVNLPCKNMEASINNMLEEAINRYSSKGILRDNTFENSYLISSGFQFFQPNQENQKFKYEEKEDKEVNNDSIHSTHSNHPKI